MSCYIVLFSNNDKEKLMCIFSADSMTFPHTVFLSLVEPLGVGSMNTVGQLSLAKIFLFF